MPRKIIAFWLIILPVVVLFYLGLIFTIQIRYQTSATMEIYRTHFRAFSVIFASWLVIFFIHGLFEISSLRRYVSLVFNLTSAFVFNLLAAITYFYFQPNLILTPRRFLLLDVAISFVLTLGWYLLIKQVVKWQFLEKVYLFSFNDELVNLEKDIQAHNYLGYKVLGHLNEQTLSQASFDKNVGIIMPANLNANSAVLQKLYDLRKLGVVFYNHNDFYENLLRRVYLTQLNELWFLENVNYREKRFYNFVKRVVDILAGLVLLIVFIVTYPFIAFLIKITSPGPVLFTQQRIGKDGKIFTVYKYRTMSGGSTDTWTAVNDPRITRIGNILRKTRIDEWPQAINLIAGDMSLVGPRPEQPKIVEELKRVVPFYDERHLVKPGLTGWAQLNVYAGSLEETKIKLQYDLYYIKNRSIIFDLEIILKTLYYIFTWQGR